MANEAQSARQFWLDTLDKVSRPVLLAGKDGKLREKMRVQQQPGQSREEFTHFEGVGRLLCGLAPWLDVTLPDGAEKDRQRETAALARSLLIGQVDPQSPDYANFESTCRLRSQILVDAAFLAQAVLRAPDALWKELPGQAKKQLTDAFLMTRRVGPWFNNWLLFSAEVEAALRMMTGEFDPMRVDYAVRQLDQWYVGDGLYADGPSFAMDYYNSFVIQPMILDVVRVFPELFPAEAYETALTRAKRYGLLQERMIAPDGSFIAVGRSIAYRCGAFHLLGQLALEHRLPAELAPAQVRTALTAVIGKTLGSASFREDGFLTIGLCGDQPSLGEGYISTGSLYLCSTGFLPLGLSPEDPFWTGPDMRWTQQKIWAGEDFSADHKIE